MAASWTWLAWNIPTTLDSIHPNCLKKIQFLSTSHISSPYLEDRPIYIWPNVVEVNRELCDVPATHAAVMARFLLEYDGILNFNYKQRPVGELRPSAKSFAKRMGGSASLRCPALRISYNHLPKCLKPSSFKAAIEYLVLTFRYKLVI